MPSSSKKKRVQSAKILPKARKSATSDLLSINAVLCQNVLTEKDGVSSAIRIVDVFFFSPVAGLPVESHAIPMRLLIIGKSQPNDKSEHICEIKLVRPSGETVSAGGAVKITLASKIPGTFTGFNVDAHIGVVPKQMGTHLFSVLLDGEEVSRLPFTLLPQSENRN